MHPGAGRVQRFVFLAWVEVHGAACGLCWRAQLPSRAGAAIGAAEHGADAWGADLVEAGTPGYRCPALWAGDLLVLPVDGEVALLVGLFRLGSSLRHGPDRPFQQDAVVALAAHQQCRIDISRVHEVLGGQ